MSSLAFPYGYYPSLYGPLAWYGPLPIAGYLPVQQYVLHGGYAQPPMGYAQLPGYAPLPGPSAPKQAIKYPMIPAWLKYCDQHPQCCGGDFSNHVSEFDKEGYHCIHQLTGDWITVKSYWIGSILEKVWWIVSFAMLKKMWSLLRLVFSQWFWLMMGLKMLYNFCLDIKVGCTEKIWDNSNIHL